MVCATIKVGGGAVSRGQNAHSIEITPIFLCMIYEVCEGCCCLVAMAKHVPQQNLMRQEEKGVCCWDGLVAQVVF